MTDRAHSLGWKIGVGLAYGMNRTFGSLFEKATIAALGAAAGLRGWKLFRDTIDMMPEAERIALARRFSEQLPEMTHRLFMPRTSDHLCEDCDEFGHGYMLKDEVWAQASHEDVDLLCLPCVEVRLGRPLMPDDFIPPELAPINGPVFFGMTIGARSECTVGSQHDENSP